MYLHTVFSRANAPCKRFTCTGILWIYSGAIAREITARGGVRVSQPIGMYMYEDAPKTLLLILIFSDESWYRWVIVTLYMCMYTCIVYAYRMCLCYYVSVSGSTNVVVSASVSVWFVRHDSSWNLRKATDDKSKQVSKICHSFVKSHQTTFHGCVRHILHHMTKGNCILMFIISIVFPMCIILNNNINCSHNNINSFTHSLNAGVLQILSIDILSSFHFVYFSHWFTQQSHKHVRFRASRREGCLALVLRHTNFLLARCARSGAEEAEHLSTTTRPPVRLMERLTSLSHAVRNKNADLSLYSPNNCILFLQSL